MQDWLKSTPEEDAKWKEGIRLTQEFDKKAHKNHWLTVWYDDYSWYVTDTDLIRWDSVSSRKVCLKADGLPDDVKLKVFERRSEVLKSQKWDSDQKLIWVAA